MQLRLIITWFPILISTIIIVPAQMIVPSPISTLLEVITEGSITVANLTALYANLSIIIFLTLANPTAQTAYTFPRDFKYPQPPITS